MNTTALRQRQRQRQRRQRCLQKVGQRKERRRG